MTEIDKVISSQFIVLSGGGPHQMRWRAIFIQFSLEMIIFYIKRPLVLRNGRHICELITNN